jgi:competence protein ComEC
MVFMLLVVPIGFQGWVLWNQTQLQDKENLILLHKSRNTVLFHQTGKVLNVLTSDTTLIGNLAANFSVAERIKITSFEPTRNSYQIGQKRLYIMDSLALFPLKQPDYLLLTQSPKINMERLLDSVQPKMVLADGSNYKSVVILWKQTCAQKEIPFHYTGEKGAFYFE